MVEGPYVFWQSDEDYVELSFEQHEKEIAEKKQHKNIHEHPEISVQLDHQSLRIPLQLNHTPAVSHYQQVDKLIAFGDIHGEYGKLVKILHAHQVIDAHLNWTFSQGHLLFCGDIFDRGKQVTECLWLIYHLEQQARQHGGCVHYLLGNHEVMSLTGDHRYLQQKYKKLAARLHLEYQDLFQPSSELGRWLRTKNTITIINDLLFVHAGLSPTINKSIAEINKLVQDYLGGDDQHYYYINDPSSPLWFRGYMYPWEGTAKVSQADFEQILKNYQVNKIIFAHTEVDSITPMYQNTAIAIDLPFKRYARALLYHAGEFYQIDEKGDKQKIL